MLILLLLLTLFLAINYSKLYADNFILLPPFENLTGDPSNLIGSQQ